MKLVDRIDGLSYRKRGMHLARVCFLLLVLHTIAYTAGAQATADLKVTARIDANKITVGDQLRLFLEAQNDSASFILHWPQIPDSFDHLEVVEKGKIDTIRQE
jgi:hypothetical protein